MKRILAATAAAITLFAVGCGKPAAPGPMVNISAEEFLGKVRTGEKLLVIDVRTEAEFALGHVPGARLVPLQTIEQGITNYAKNQEIYLICRSGNRSGQAYTILQGMGYTKLHNVTGGMTDWERLGGAMER